MGMFDHLTVKHELPDGFEPAGIEFQTKDTDAQQLSRYILREDGTLWSVDAGEAEALHGSMHFYASNWAGSFARLQCTSDDLPPWRAEYVALFDRGKLLKIEGPGYYLVENVEHVPRADFDRQCEDVKRSLAKPGDDLHTEWVHWMGLCTRPLFEQVKWPALEVRMHALWSRCAWGYRSITDDPNAYMKDLRDWSGWLAQEEGLTPELEDLLARTKALLASFGEAEDGSE